MCFYLPFFLPFANFSIFLVPAIFFLQFSTAMMCKQKLEQQNNSVFNSALKAKHNLREYYLKNKNSTHH